MSSPSNIHSLPTPHCPSLRTEDLENGRVGQCGERAPDDATQSTKSAPKSFFPNIFPKRENIFFVRVIHKVDFDPTQQSTYLPQGHIFCFILTALVTAIFGMPGFLFTFLLHSTEASKYGSLSGLAFSVMVYGIAFLVKAVNGDMSSSAYGGEYSPPLLKLLSFTFFVVTFIAFLLILYCVSHYHNIRTWNRMVVDHNLTPQDTRHLWIELVSSASVWNLERDFQRTLVTKLGLLTEDDIVYVIALKRQKSEALKADLNRYYDKGALKFYETLIEAHLIAPPEVTVGVLPRCRAAEGRKEEEEELVTLKDMRLG